MKTRTPPLAGLALIATFALDGPLEEARRVLLAPIVIRWATWAFQGPELCGRWAVLIHPAYEVDPPVCPRCGGPMRIVAFITEPKVIRKILLHLAAKDIDARTPPGPRERHPTSAWPRGVWRRTSLDIVDAIAKPRPAPLPGKASPPSLSRSPLHLVTLARRPPAACPAGTLTPPLARVPSVQARKDIPIHSPDSKPDSRPGWAKMKGALGRPEPWKGVGYW